MDWYVAMGQLLGWLPWAEAIASWCQLLPHRSSWPNQQEVPNQKKIQTGMRIENETNLRSHYIVPVNCLHVCFIAVQWLWY